MQSVPQPQYAAPYGLEIWLAPAGTNCCATAALLTKDTPSISAWPPADAIVSKLNALHSCGMQQQDCQYRVHFLLSGGHAP
jgi:hypothetical protein